MMTSYPNRHSESPRMTRTRTHNNTHHRIRNVGAALFGFMVGFSAVASALGADVVTLRVGDQKGGNRALLEIAGLAKDLPYKIEWSEFPAAAPILEALNAGALDFGYTGDLAFLTVYAAGAPIKAIGGTRSDARTQAILVRNDSPIKSIADLKGKRLAGTRGGWGQFLIDATLEKATASTTRPSHRWGRWTPRSRLSPARSTAGRYGSPTFPTQH
jgi:sulfonate transport system substrate-binding protein